MSGKRIFSFQYPLRVEVGCNSVWSSFTRQFWAIFSTLYGSKWVATSRRDGRPRRPPVFSTLYGSKWVATWHRGRSFPRFPPGFQYPLRVEVGCNRTCNRLSKLVFRVFSTLYGSKWVATRIVPMPGIGTVDFSVPSTGRSGLQHGALGTTC